VTAPDRVVSYVNVPDGTYRCRIAEVRPGTTRAGDERWALRLTVEDGDYAGRMAAWDSLVFSNRGRARARRVLQALGLPCAGKVTIEPADVEGRTAMVRLVACEYQTAAGDTVRRSEVPYDGFAPDTGGAQ
jgi:hypothetical protein